MIFPLAPVDERHLAFLADEDQHGASAAIFSIGQKLNEIILKVNKIERELYEEVEPMNVLASQVVGVVLEARSRSELGREVTDWAQTVGGGKTIVKIQATSETTVLIVYRTDL
jgi:hypothetical protein